jgi:hypothetical protein
MPPLFGFHDPVDDVSVPVPPLYVRLERAEVTVVAPIPDLGPCPAVVGDFARWRLLVVDVQRNEIADLHPIAITVADDVALVRWQGQQTNCGE